MQIFRIRDEFITLGQLLKAADIVSSGAEVKPYLATHEIHVNGEFEIRRGKKLRHGDVVRLPGGKSIQIEASEEFRPA